MAWYQEFPSVASAGERAEKAWRLPMGAASPLWMAFGAAASAGVAYWWLTRWTTVVNIEALAGKTAPGTAPSVSEIITEPEPKPAVTQPAAEARTELALEAAEIKTPTKPAAPKPTPPDDLTRMSGIGPKLSLALAERGVTRFAQIAGWTAHDLAEIDRALSLKGRAVREAWVAQAKRLAASVL